ncbi:NAD(P)-dependent dehydrogenase, short-chain alcohol dehydrogenase family [Saccharopolyspora kobensis]|uniref:NAD(P)-dependent dehydrogenase, short-chain alcohol dehydrogenase family n=1 Tax=Saccharopolyspora kobensis TaxID=146035 RepID=A0A1H6A5B0_9PSEU|nr:SDR family oxidoreductase [Saccharopolyspora kobensis]SEG43611.1 NAD(P)-dependent dehydrogenase, short-chain alcohol dehydrogenase family [Saccharopolyspora kobensis]SFE19759.1 NAD(P)-dependent dehydrogenase, short-chain alcohol dehydrogenase family [Saccharopolyspora kobensis]
MTLAGKSVVVTGAATGIGRGIAECLLSSEANVTIVGRREEPLRELAEQHGDAVAVVAQDICAPGAAERIIATATDRFGRLDAVVNNAGLARFGGLDSIDPTEFDAMFAVNVRAPADLIRCALPWLRAGRGSVVNVSSVGGVLSMPGRAFYGATKAALNSLTRSLARELAPEVRVNAILPGPVDTPMWAGTGLDDAGIQQLRVDLTSSTPMGRFGEDAELGRWVCLLIDPEVSGWITGALIPVDGGRTA